MSFDRQVLDHGYIKVVESWGSDERIIESARMSVQGGFKGWGPLPCPGCKNSPIAGTIFVKQFIDDGMGSEQECAACKGRGEVVGDEKLLRYLWEHKHMSPFEMAGATLEIQAPIFVFREWHRHRTQSYNEASARYSPLADLNYEPTLERCLQDGRSNKQAGRIAEVDADEIQNWLEAVGAFYGYAEQLYRSGLSVGVPKEVARIVLPVGRYSKMRASANLRNWLAFLTLRVDPAAQWEIRQYADAVAGALADKFPRTLALWQEAGVGVAPGAGL